MVSHKGTVVSFASDDARRIYYSILELNGENDTAGLDVDSWFDTPRELIFSNEITQVGYGILDPVVIPVFKKGVAIEQDRGTLLPDEIDPFLSTTARFTSDAEFQVLSDGKFIYLFRQAIHSRHKDMVYARNDDGIDVLDNDGNKVALVNSTLLLDRFVLAGGQLKKKMEVRFKRSRNKYHGLNEKDSLGARDLEENPFYEPTMELSFITDMSDGSFSVMLLPTQVAAVKRWQIFSQSNGHIHSFNIERSSDGLFNTRGTQFYTSPDPQYQKSVFEREPGTDQFTGKPLIPIPTKSLYAESALQFEKNQYVSFGSFEFPKNNFTIEFWLKLHSYEQRYQTIVYHGAVTKGPYFYIMIWASGSISFSFFDGEGNASYMNTSAFIADYEWHYWACSFESETKTKKIYLDGVLIEEGKSSLMFEPKGNLFFGTFRGGRFNLTGILDEVSIWNRARFADEIAADMNFRLEGNEPGLIGYWHFDEGSRDKVYDKTEKQHTGTIHGNPKWVTSDAPIGEHPGIHHSKFKIQNRSLMIGLTSILYYQQEKTPTGYDQVEKPLKNAARVMLSFGSTLNSQDPTVELDATATVPLPKQLVNNNSKVSILDFAVSRDGKLAQVPDIISLPSLSVNRPGEININEAIEIISTKEKRIQMLQAHIRRMEGSNENITKKIPQIDKNISKIEGKISNLEEEIRNLQNLQYIVNIKTGSIHWGGTDADVFITLNGTVKASREVKLPAHSNDFERGNLDSFGPFNVGEIGRLKSVHIRHNNRRFASGWYLAYIDVRIYNESRYLDRLHFRCNNWLATDSGDGRIARTLYPSQTSAVKDRDELNRLLLDENTNKKHLEDEKAKFIDQRSEQEFQIQSKMKELTNEKKLMKNLGERMGATQPIIMSLLNIDALGLSLSGGILDFTEINGSPQLFDSATGQLLLYFRAPNDQLLSAYYDTMTERSQTLTPAEIGNVSFVGRSSEEELDETTISISDGPSTDNCTIQIENSKMNRKETWTNVPREVQSAVNIINGTTKKSLIGVLESQTFDVVEEIKLQDSVGKFMKQGDILQIGKSRFEVSSNVDRKTQVIPIYKAKMETYDDTSVYFLSYDYANLSTTNKVEANLENGSSLVIMSGTDAHGNLKNYNTTGNSTSSCQWTPTHPGMALTFDGKTQYIHMAFKDPHALEFDGRSDKIDIPYSVTLNPPTFTVECWAKLDGRQKDICGSPLTSRGHNRGFIFYFREKERVWEFWIGESTHFTTIISPPSDDDNWTHLVGTYNNTTKTMSFFVNGSLVGEKENVSFAPNRNYPLRIGGGATETPNGSYFFSGLVDEVRIWNRALSVHEINEMKDYLRTGMEENLVGYWRLDERLPKDYTKYGNDSNNNSGNSIKLRSSSLSLKHPDVSRTRGFYLFKLVSDGDITIEAWINPTAVTGDTRAIHYHFNDEQNFSLGFLPVRSRSSVSSGNYNCYVGVKGTEGIAETNFRLNEWRHFAIVYHQSYALEFNGNSFLSVPHSTTIDITRDMTIELFVRVDDLSKEVGLLSKGRLISGNYSSVPYSLSITERGRLTFRFEDRDGGVHSFSAFRIKKGIFYKLAITRSYEFDETSGDSGDVEHWYDIRIFIDGKEEIHKKYEGPSPAGNEQPLEIGKVSDGAKEHYLTGVISELRIYNRAINKEDLCTKINGNEEGLISWWKFEENEGTVAVDSKQANNAVVNGARWTKSPDEDASKIQFYSNGTSYGLKREIDDRDFENWGSRQFSIGCMDDNDEKIQFFTGSIAELRIWKTARTVEQILDNMFSTIKEERDKLLSYYTFDVKTDRDDNYCLIDRSLMENDVPFLSGGTEPLSVISTAPVGNDIPQVKSSLGGVDTVFNSKINSRPSVGEYGDMQYDINGKIIGVHKRCYGFVVDQEWLLMTGLKVGDLITEWVSQTQSSPQIIGYIEGAPPVPSENLSSTTLKHGEFEDYVGSSSVEFEESEEVNYIFTSSSESGHDTLHDSTEQIAISTEIDVNFLETSFKAAGLDIKLGHNKVEETSKRKVSESTDRSGINKTRTSRLELRGAWEVEGYEINPAVGRRFIPYNTGIAVVQSDTLDIFALRLTHNNALLSYRIMPNNEIPKDWNIISFPINNTYTKQGTLDGRVGVKQDGSVQCDPQYPNAASYGHFSYFKPIEAYALKRKIDHQKQELKTFFEQQNTDIDFKNSSDKLSRLSSRNIVNAYIWTAEGGLFTESTDVLDTVDESITSSYSSITSKGLSDEFMVAGIAPGFSKELNSLDGTYNGTIKTKRTESEKSFNVKVELSGESDLQLYVNTEEEKQKYAGRINEGYGAYDIDGNPVMRPGKVDAYRFMTFYLESNKNNFEDFFNKVVDPIWLEQSADPNAVSLRKANDADKKPKCWRIMHRVTYISRILPDITAENAPPMEKNMKISNINSSYELIRKLSPFVRSKRNDPFQFRKAIHDSLRAYLPELAPHEDDIVQYLSLYFDVEDAF